MTTVADHLAAGLDPVVLATRLGYDVEPWQASLLRSTSRRVAVLAARQTGKSSMLAVVLIHAAIYQPQSLQLVVSPSQRQSDEMLRRVLGAYRTMERPISTTAANGSTLELSNGSRVVSLPGSEATIRGFSGASTVIFDESAFIQTSVFESALPMVGPRGRVIAATTAGGPMGWFWSLWTAQGQPGDVWQRHRVRASESKQYTPQRLAEIRRLVGDFSYRTDYEAEFGDADGALFGERVLSEMFSRDVEPLRLEEG